MWMPATRGINGWGRGQPASARSPTLATATTALSRRRVERDEVELFLRDQARRVARPCRRRAASSLTGCLTTAATRRAGR